MSILGRIRTMLLQRELAALRAAGRAERDQAQTTDDMMHNMVARAQRIVEIEHAIGKITGGQDDDDDSYLGDDSCPRHSFAPALPSDFGIPTPDESETEAQHGRVQP